MYYRKLSSLLAITAASLVLFCTSCSSDVDTAAVFADAFSTDFGMKGELYIYRNRAATPSPTTAEADAVAIPAPAPVPPLESELKKTAVKRMLENGMSAYNLKNYDAAINDFNSLLEVDAENKNNAEIKLYLAISYLAKGDATNAKAIFNQLIKKDNQHSFRAEAEWYLALTLLKSRELDEAKKLLKYIAKDKKDHPYQDKAKAILAKIS